MSKTIEQVQKTALANFQQNIQPAQVIGFFLEFVGTNAAATTSALSDLGRVIIKREGVQLVNTRISTLALLQDYRGGSNVFRSVEAGNFEATIFVPLYELGAPQALNIIGDSELNISYEKNPDGVANFADLTVTVSTEEEELREYYNYYILDDDEPFSGASSSRPIQMNMSNITNILLQDPDSVFTQASYKNNRGEILSNQSKLLLEAKTIKDAPIEADGFAMQVIKLYTKSVLQSYLNRANVLTASTSGAGDLFITKTAIQPNEAFIRLANEQLNAQ